MSIYKLKPTFKDYLWGGTWLKEIYQGIDEMPIVAEAWVLSCHKDGMSISDEEKPRTLQTIWEEDYHQTKRFPIMVKLIDAKQKLSIQVHPNDELGYLYENENGKTEVWYVLDALPGSYLYYGFNQEMSSELVKKAIKDGTITQFLNRVMVKGGDVIFVPAGTVHAIGEGITVAEIQQNSNTTYRLYDFDRRDVAGNLRELHIEESLRVLNYHPTVVQSKAEDVFVEGFSGEIKKICSCEYFDVMWYHVVGEAHINLDPNKYYHVLVIDGNGTCLEQDLIMGDGLLLDGTLDVKGNVTFLLTSFS